MADDLTLLTVGEVAAILRRSRSCVCALIASGSLPVVRLGAAAIDPHARGRKDYRVRRDDLEAFLAARTARVGVPEAPTPRPPTTIARPAAGPVPALWDGRDRFSRPKKAGP
jgi:Helix-turn-helix domain